MFKKKNEGGKLALGLAAEDKISFLRNPKTLLWGLDFFHLKWKMEDSTFSSFHKG